MDRDDIPAISGLTPLPMLCRETHRRWLNLALGWAPVGCIAKASCASSLMSGTIHVSTI